MEGLATEQMLICLAIVVAALALSLLFSRKVVRAAGLWVMRTKNPTAEAILAGLVPAIRFIPIVAAAFAITVVVEASADAKAVVFKVDRSLIVFVLFLALFGIVAPAFDTVEARSTVIGDAMAGWAIRVARIVIVLLGIGVVLEIWDIHVGPVLAGLGLVGAAVALGAQDLFKNLIAGIFVIGEQRFESGDWVRVDGVVEGTVEAIGLRATRIRRFDLAPVFVPNSKLADNALTNFSKMTYRRISWIIGLEYGATVDQLRQIRDEIEAYIQGNDAFVKSDVAPCFVRIDSFADSSINMMIYCFTRTIDWGEWLKTKEAFAYALKGIVEQAGSGFAFPSRSIYVETVPTAAELYPLHQQASENTIQRQNTSHEEASTASTGP